MSSIACLSEGARLIWQPGFRALVVVPILINTLVFAGLAGYGVTLFSDWMAGVISWLPGWLDWLTWLLWMLFALVFLVVLFYGFTMVANIIAAPFNAVLAIRVESFLGHKTEGPDPTLLALIPRTIARELQKIAYFLPRMLLLVVLSFIPLLQAVAVPLWIAFGAWMMTVQYTDYAADNNNIDFATLRKLLGENKTGSFGFGFVVYAAMLIPLVNLVVIPSAVAGGTVYFVRELRRT